jgi:hypothetical protein
MKIREIIVEGGNVWKGDMQTIRIPRDLVSPTVSFLEQITGLPLLNNMLGTTGKAETSGDIDLSVDASTITKDELTAKLKTWAAQNDETAQTKKTGNSVHFRCPIAGKNFLNYVQVDFMFFEDMTFSHWVYRAPVESQFKNAARTILIASVAKYFGLRFSPERGLVNRENDKPLAQAKNPDYIAKLILNKKATGKDLGSVESILTALKNDPLRDKKLEDARKTLPMYGVPPEVMK